MIDSLSKLKKSNDWVFDLKGNIELLEIANSALNTVFIGCL